MEPAAHTLRPRRHPLTKAAFLLLGILIASLGGACLVPTFLHHYFVTTKRSQRPEDIQRIADQITNITLPADFEPSDSFELDQFGSQTRAACWRTKTGGIAVVFELPAYYDSKVLVDVHAELQQFPLLNSQAEGFSFAFSSTRTIETINVRGEQVDFAILQPDIGSAVGMVVSGTPPRSEVTGCFPSKSGKRAGVWLVAPATNMKAEQLLDFVKSVR